MGSLSKSFNVVLLFMLAIQFHLNTYYFAISPHNVFSTTIRFLFQSLKNISLPLSHDLHISFNVTKFWQLTRNKFFYRASFISHHIFTFSGNSVLFQNANVHHHHRGNTHLDPILNQFNTFHVFTTCSSINFNIMFQSVLHVTSGLLLKNLYKYLFFRICALVAFFV
jgi:hypothetical protein